MMKTVVSIWILLVLFVCCMLVGCSKAGDKQGFHRHTSAGGVGKLAPAGGKQGLFGHVAVGSDKLTSAVNDMGFRLYSKLDNVDHPKNIFISPASIELALAMVYNGAGGTTKDAMSTALGYTGMSVSDVNTKNAGLMASLTSPAEGMELNIANSLWSSNKYTFNPDFISTNQEYYQAEVAEVDMNQPQTADRINGWVSDKTKGKIPTILTSGDIANALMVLVNAVYFKGEWLTQFPKHATRDDNFMLLDGKVKRIPMMNLTDRFLYMENSDFQAVSLPYKGAQNNGASMSMYIVLPKRGKSWKDFTYSLNAANWETWVAQMKNSGKRKGMVTLPKFKQRYFTTLNSSLIGLGMGLAFDPNNADFSGMLPAGSHTIPPPYISKVLHKTTLDVDEEGTVATAATAVVMMPGGLGLSPREAMFVMRIDHPFFVAIADNNTGVLLFLGTVVDP